MYRRVDTEEEMNLFDSIWIPAWQEKGFDLECSLGTVERYLIHNEQSQYIGTVSLRPYDCDSTIDDVFPFYRNEIIISNPGKIVEIDKLAVIKDHRGFANLEKVLLTIFEHMRITCNKYYIATIDFLLFKALQKFYHATFIQVEKRINYKGNYLVPIIIDAHHILNNIEHYKWLRDFHQSNRLSVNI